MRSVLVLLDHSDVSGSLGLAASLCAVDPFTNGVSKRSPMMVATEALDDPLVFLHALERRAGMRHRSLVLQPTWLQTTSGH